MYFRVSDETPGTAKYVLVGWRISPNSAGLSAKRCVALRLLASLSCLTCLTLSFKTLELAISEGEASTSHRQNLFY